MLKPNQSHLFFDIFKIKMLKAFSKRELLSSYDRVASTGLEVILQEYIPGDERLGVNYNSYVWDQKFCAEFTASKVRLSPVDSGVPCVVMSKMIPEVIEPGRKILKALGFYGYSCTEFKLDTRDQVYKLMEVNGRHNRSTMLAVRCGLNFPYLEYQNLTQGRLENNSGYKSSVYWIDLSRDIYTAPKYLKRPGYSFAMILKPYLSKHVFAEFDVHDMKPLFKRLSILIQKIFRKTKRTKILENRDQRLNIFYRG
jgi:predicted ATP-grasp superfamily ATP-dependent carboligase